MHVFIYYTFSRNQILKYPQKEKEKRSVYDSQVQLRCRQVGTGDAEYLAVLAEQLPHVLDSFRPDLVLYDAGIDP